MVQKTGFRALLTHLMVTISTVAGAGPAFPPVPLPPPTGTIVSLFISGTYANPIEYRFAHTTGIVIANNVLDGNIAARDGATGSVSGNYMTASAGSFVNPSAGDLHLKPTATVLLNKVAAPPAAAGVDWDGQARPAGSADIGADEYSTGTTLTTPNAPANLRIVGA